jgi:lipoic acid synthetase
MSEEHVPIDGRHPEWLKVRMEGGKERVEMHRLLRNSSLHTVCESAKCPNLCDCWKRRTATFMILGNTCTRCCRFCAVSHGRPEPVDPDEPKRVAEAIQRLGLKYAVITCVTRDDMPDGGSTAMANTVLAVRQMCPGVKVEVLCSDYNGQTVDIDRVLHAQPVVFGHNVETVRRLTPQIRSKASYDGSLAVLRHAAEQVRQEGLAVQVKSGLMLGLGETEEDIRECLRDLREAGVTTVTMGQYLRPTAENWPVSRYVTPAEFAFWQKVAEGEYGFSRAVCGPLIRSSYLAEEAYERANENAR